MHHVRSTVHGSKRGCNRVRAFSRILVAVAATPSNKAMAQQPSDKVYVVLVTGKVKPGTITKFKELFKPLADHVAAHEEGCLSYQLSVGETDPDTLCIFERYISKEYLETVHWQSEPFKKFGAGMREADLWVDKSVTKYWEERPGDWGYMAR